MRSKGYWAGLAAKAENDAEVLTPRRGSAATWLRKQREPNPAIARTTHTVWMSCDGSAAIARGTWSQGDAIHGWYATVWKRQKKGAYKWALDQSGPLTTPQTEPDWIDGAVADCPVRKHGNGAPPPVKGVLPPLPGPVPASDAAIPADRIEGRSIDGSLVWRTIVLADGSRDLRVWLWRGGSMHQVWHMETPGQ